MQPADPQPATIPTQPSVGEQPVQQQPTQTTPQTEPDIIKATKVAVSSSNMFADAILGALIWNSDNTIELAMLVDGQARVAFCCSPQEILKFSYYTNRTTIKLRNGQSYYINLNPDFLEKSLDSSITDAVSTALGGAMGLGFYVGADGLRKDIGMLTMDGKNDSVWWVESLKRFGVNAKRTSAAKLGLILLGVGLGGLIIVAFTIAAISVYS